MQISDIKSLNIQTSGAQFEKRVKKTTKCSFISILRLSISIFSKNCYHSFLTQKWHLQRCLKKHDFNAFYPIFQRLRFTFILKVSLSQNEILVSSNLTKSQPNFRQTSALARAEICLKFGMAFLEIWRHQNFILRITDL